MNFKHSIQSSQDFFVHYCCPFTLSSRRIDLVCFRIRFRCALAFDQITGFAV